MEVYGWENGARRPLPVSWSVPGGIADICCGENHVLFVTGEGLLFTWGQNSKQQLGRNGVENTTKPGRVIGRVVAMACGQNHSLAVSEAGKVCAWGASDEGQLGFGPNPSSILLLSVVDLPLPIPVVQVACGNSHSLALTKDGSVFSWGSNSHGQLGLGKQVSVQSWPAPLLSLTGVAVTQVSAGGAHTLLLTLCGLVYCFGANKYGQLGVNRVDEKGRFSMCVVPALRPLRISVISCGAAHSAVLTEDGKVFTFGKGSHGQLGHNSTADELLPRQVEVGDGPVVQIACGSYHTLMLTSSGCVWRLGSGDKNRSGDGDSGANLAPALAQLPWTTNGAAAAPSDLRIAAGWNSNFIYISTKKCPERTETVGRLDATKLTKWLAMEHGNPEAELEISSMFWTSSSLVASFTKTREPPSSPSEFSADIEAASQTFDQLCAKPWIKKTINLKLLVDQLYESHPTLRSPEVLVILPTCPLLQEDSNALNVVMPLVVAITVMNDKALKSLKSLWSSLKPSLLLKNIVVFRGALCFLLKNGLLATHNQGVRRLLQVLKMLYKANTTGKTPKVPLKTFYIPEINDTVNPFVDVKLWSDFSNVADEEDRPAIFCRYPFVFDLPCKMGFFNILAFIIKKSHQLSHVMMWPPEMIDVPDASQASVFQLNLRRTHLVEDTFRQLGIADHCAFQRELLVQFVDVHHLKVMDVNKRDFFINVFEELMAPESQMFKYNDSRTLAWFPATPQAEPKRYFLFGVLCGMALYNHNIIHLPFPLVLFKKLVCAKPSLEDMKEFEPVMARSFCSILDDYTSEELNVMHLTFKITWDGKTVELDPKEEGKPLTSSNKKEFVGAFINFVFNESVEKVFDEFKRGFFKVCHMDVIEFFQPEELQGVMVGEQHNDWDLMKQNTVYQGEYHDKHPNIINFWEVFDELTKVEKDRFLLFLTGVDRVPVFTPTKIQMTIALLPNSTELYFPESLTCHSLLLLPNYRRYPAKRTLRNKLLGAIYHCRGFWKE